MRIGHALVWITSAIPLALWLAARPLEERVATWQTTVGSASKALGLLGLTLLAWAVILAARLRPLERAFDGLDRAYRQHHLVGGAAFVLILLHPTLLAARYASVSLDRAAGLWLPTAEDWPLTLGQLAVYPMVPALVATIFVRVRHRTFVWSQRLLGILLIPAAAHVLLIRGDARDFLPLRAYLLALVAVAVLAFVHHPLLSSTLARRHRFRLRRIRLLGDDVTELVLAPVGRSMHFVPGQFVFLRLADEHLGGEPHPFSIASAPTESDVRLVVKRLGDFTSRLPEAHEGSDATLEGPYGTFSYRHWPTERQLWIAGGIGLAPFLGMARSLAGGPGHRVDLWYGHARTDDPFLAELQELERAVPGLRVFAVCEADDGFIDAKRIEQASGLEDREILLCGPHAMMEALRGQFLERGVRASRIHYEDFAFR
jgi:predicted ferric reductase